MLLCRRASKILSVRPFVCNYATRKSMANQPNPGLSRKGILFDHRFASFKAVLHFLVSQNVSFLRCVPFWTPFLITFLLPSKQYCTFQGPNMVQHKLSKIVQKCVTTNGDDERTTNERTDAHRIFEALLHKSPFGAKMK